MKKKKSIDYIQLTKKKQTKMSKPRDKSAYILPTLGVICVAIGATLLIQANKRKKEGKKSTRSIQVQATVVRPPREVEDDGDYRYTYRDVEVEYLDDPDDVNSDLHEGVIPLYHSDDALMVSSRVYAFRSKKYDEELSQNEEKPKSTTGLTIGGWFLLAAGLSYTINSAVFVFRIFG